MTTKHTPGPWSVKKTNCGHGAVTAGTYTLRHNWDGLGSQEEMDANARLIAASPELLDALKLALEAHDYPGREGWAENARAAISKAEGRS